MKEYTKELAGLYKLADQLHDDYVDISDDEIARELLAAAQYIQNAITALHNAKAIASLERQQRTT